MKKTVYVVDDSRMMRDFLYNILSNDYEVLTFEDGDDLFSSLITNQKPSLVLCDYHFKNQDGLDILNKMKEKEAFEDASVIFLSGEQRSEVRINCLANGADDFINKPFNPIELKLRIERMVSISSNGLSRRAGHLEIAS